ncbi:MAG: hypothetical protein KY469_11980 [Actinobacteria bacterium]|nr:hypothetical protein [Actinomycetota bacterium]
MNDVRDILERYAAQPTEPLDLGRIAQRAGARRRWRRTASIGTTLGVAALTIAVLAAASSLPTRPAVVGGVPETPVIEESTRLVPGSGPGSGGAVESPSEPSPSLERTATPRVSTRVPSPDPAPPLIAPVRPGADASPTTPSPRTTPAQHEGCRVEVGDTPCTYVATRPGGYEADGDGNWMITIERGEETLIFAGEVNDRCGPTGTIQPGDRVTVDSGRGRTPVVVEFGSHSFVAAGTDWGTWC